MEKETRRRIIYSPHHARSKEQAGTIIETLADLEEVTGEQWGTEWDKDGRLIFKQVEKTELRPENDQRGGEISEV